MVSNSVGDTACYGHKLTSGWRSEYLRLDISNNEGSVLNGVDMELCVLFGSAQSAQRVFEHVGLFLVSPALLSTRGHIIAGVSTAKGGPCPQAEEDLPSFHKQPITFPPLTAGTIPFPQAGLVSKWWVVVAPTQLGLQHHRLSRRHRALDLRCLACQRQERGEWCCGAVWSMCYSCSCDERIGATARACHLPLQHLPSWTS